MAADTCASLAQGIRSPGRGVPACAYSTRSRCAKPIAGRSKTSAFPSIVLMENAGRQVVAAMEAAFDELATHARRGAVRTRQQRRRRVRRRAHAARARRRRRRVPGRATPRTSKATRARISRCCDNLGARRRRDRATRPAWELHGTDVLGSRPHRRRAVRHGHRAARSRAWSETIVADVNASDAPGRRRSICRAACSADRRRCRRARRSKRR